ncbi:sensor histidine kinase [Polaromonas aquatica]|uniref:histidine kinase n=1 Tax=Polaromonas aquatica TaxID=332657 RepID=A0ABW1TYU8_9BURK
MDGFKRRLNESLQMQLSFWLTVAILAIALAAGTFSFLAAFSEANELQDDVLTQVAALFDRQRSPTPQLESQDALADSDEESRVTIQFLPAPGSTVSALGTGSVQPQILDRNLHDGIQTVTVNEEDFRILVKTLASGQRLVVAQETGVRDEIARNSALRTLMPFIILVPILLLLLADVVRRIFRPIAVLSKEIDSRGEQSLHSFSSDDLPKEIRPFVHAINRLLARVSQSIDAQRRFVADAAHELRSPLTALSLQAERLSNAEMSVTARNRLELLQKGLSRNRKLLDQLLAFNRIQSGPVESKTDVSILGVYRQVLEDAIPLAEVKNIDIGISAAGDARVLCSEIELLTLIRNLVDNAVRYTPQGGRVDLALDTTENRIRMEVTDTGPGIPLNEQQRVLDPFYRVIGNGETGSGLGLSIVQAIVIRMGWELSLEFADTVAASGLKVTVIASAAKRTKSPA